MLVADLCQPLLSVYDMVPDQIHIHAIRPERIIPAIFVQINSVRDLASNILA